MFALFRKKRIKKFTIIELIVVVLVIGLLSGLVIPKVVGIKRDAEVANLKNDIDVLSNAISMYNVYEDSLPLGEKVIAEGELLNAIRLSGDSGEQLYKIDISKSKKYHTKLKSRVDNEHYFIYSKETGKIFYTSGIKNSDGKLVFGLDDYDEYSIKLGNLALSTKTVNKVNNATATLTGQAPINKDVNIILNGTDVPVTYPNISFSTYNTNIFAGTEYKKFTANINLQKDIINILEVKIGDVKRKYSVKVENFTSNEVDLSQFNRVIYVDILNGDDSLGTGDKENPYKTLDKAILASNDKDAIKLDKGIYTLNVKLPGHEISIIGEGKDTEIKSLSGVIGTSGGIINIYKLIWSYNNRFLNFVDYKVNAYNVVFRTVDGNYDYNYLLYSNLNDHYFENCVIYSQVSSTKSYYSKQILIGGFKTVTLKNSYYQDLNNGTYRYNGNYKVEKSIIRDIFIDSYFSNSLQGTSGTASIDENFNITTNNWYNTGIDENGNPTHVGVYGGKYAWNNSYIANNTNSTNEINSSFNTTTSTNNFRYLIFEVYDHYSSNSATITEITVYDKNNNIIIYNIGEAYDYSRNSYPYYWNSNNFWGYDNLYDNQTSYTSNLTGLYSSLFVNGPSNANSGMWTRFVLDLSSEKEIGKIEIWAGSPEGRIPYYIKVFGTNSYNYDSNIKLKSNVGLNEIDTINFNGSEYSVQKYTINLN